MLPLHRKAPVSHHLSSLDRLVRLVLAVLLAEAGFFWLGSPWSWVAYGVAAVMLVTALLRYCPLYALLGLGKHSRRQRPQPWWRHALAVLLLLLLVVGGSLLSDRFTRTQFLEAFNGMNHHYKQTLFLTGKQQRDNAIAEYGQWVSTFSGFQQRYAQYRPYALRADRQLDADLIEVERLMREVEPLVRQGDLQQAHLDLEKVRPIFQELLRRNGFSLLSVALVDFHDAMELMLDAANANDPARLISLYPAVNDKMMAVETAAPADPEILAIRQHLDRLRDLANTSASANALSERAEQLKGSFVKVYLKRG